MDQRVPLPMKCPRANAQKCCGVLWVPAVHSSGVPRARAGISALYPALLFLHLVVELSEVDVQTSFAQTVRSLMNWWYKYLGRCLAGMVSTPVQENFSLSLKASSLISVASVVSGSSRSSTLNRSIYFGEVTVL